MKLVCSATLVRLLFAETLTVFSHVALQEPLPEAAALLLRHPGICSVWGYGSLLSDGGVPHPVRHVNTITAHYLPFLQYLLPRSLFPSLNFTRRGVSRMGTQNELLGHSDQQENDNRKIVHLKATCLQSNLYVLALIFVFQKFYETSLGWNLSKINGWVN